MEANVFEVSLSLKKMNNDNEYRADHLSTIVSIIVALLNSQGGCLNIKFEDYPCSDKNGHGALRRIEQRLIKLMGSRIFISKVKISPGSEDVAQVITVHPSEFLCTADYHLYIPTHTQAVLISSCEGQEKVKAILNRDIRDITALQQDTVYEDFILNRKVPSAESESDSIQFKQLKSEKSKCFSLADRMINKSNKLRCYISAFCNKIGGKILYGVRDDGIIEGEKVSGRDQEEITRKVTKVFSTMIWSNGKLEKGKNWNIAFNPVIDERGNDIPCLFVIEISVKPLSGGVFTQQPECYYVEQGKMKTMFFEQWKFRFLHSDIPRTTELVPTHVRRVGWSTVKNQKLFYRISGNLLMYANKGDLPNFRKFSKMVNEIYSGTELLVMGEEVRYAYKKGFFKKAERLFSKLEKLPLANIGDLAVMQLRAVYLKFEIARAEGDYEESYKIAQQGLELAHSAPAGIFTAYFYADVAYLEGMLAKKDQARKTSLLHSASCHYTKAIQYTQASEVEQELSALISDIRHKVYITRAMTTTLRHGANFRDATPSDIEEAKKDLICSCRLSIEGAHRTKFREISYLLAEGDLLLRQWWLGKTQEGINGQEYETPATLRKAFDTVNDAIERSIDLQYEELFIHANKSLATITEITIIHNFVSSPSAARLRQKRSQQQRTLANCQ